MNIDVTGGICFPRQAAPSLVRQEDAGTSLTHDSPQQTALPGPKRIPGIEGAQTEIRIGAEMPLSSEGKSWHRQEALVGPSRSGPLHQGFPLNARVNPFLSRKAPQRRAPLRQVLPLSRHGRNRNISTAFGNTFKRQKRTSPSSIPRQRSSLRRC